MDLILDILMAVAALVLTTVVAAPIVFRKALGARWLSKVVLSFALGCVIILLAGIFAALIGLDPVIISGGMALIGAGLSLRDSNIIFCWRWERLDREDWIVLGVGFLYLFICLFFFDRIIMWMGGDAVAHATIIRMLIDRQAVPISLPALGSYWDYYPKGFHYYSYLWAKLFPMLNVIQTIPVLMTAMTSMLLYSIVRELARKEESVYTFVLACFVFPAHYAYLIWAGYPSIFAEMLMVAAILCILVDKRLLPILLLGILFAHPRMLVLTCGVILVYMAATRFSRNLPQILAGLVVLIVAAFAALPVHRPEFFISIFSSRDLTSEYLARWFPAFLSLFGVVIALTRRDRLDRLTMAWTGAIVIVILLADFGTLRFIGSADRLLLGLYLPLSLLAASALSKMAGAGPKIRAGFLLILILSGTAAMIAVFYSYAGAWAIPQEDYEAIMWLGKQNYSDTICINLDETGSWIYPLTGIKVANSPLEPSVTKFNMDLIQKIIIDPGNRDLIGPSGDLSKAQYLIYISNVSISRPAYIPPFAEYHQTYPVVNLSFPEESYDLIYSKGVYIFRPSLKETVPGKAGLIAPKGSINASGPTFRWNKVSGATYYYLWVDEPSSNTFQKWYMADDVEGGSSCQITPNLTICGGTYTWWIQTWNSAGYGPWSDPMRFNLERQVKLISPFGLSTKNPSFTWNSVPGETWYYLWVDGPSGNVLKKWYKAGIDIICSGKNCSVTSPLNLNWGDYTWWVQTYNEPCGEGSWSDPMKFSLRQA